MQFHAYSIHNRLRQKFVTKKFIDRPGAWVQRYTETWNSSITLTSLSMEMKAGTFKAEANPPGKAIFDNFVFALTNQ